MRTLKTVILTFLFIAIITVVAILLFIYSGIYNVSALSKENPLLLWIITATRDHSIAKNTANIAVPAKLDDPKMVMEGFKAYKQLCVSCHLAPGLNATGVSQGLNPSPPNFSQWKKGDLSPAETFWIIKNGIRMTGMPAWGVTQNDEKIWALTAFAVKLPGMGQAEYQSMARQIGPGASLIH